MNDTTSLIFKLDDENKEDGRIRGWFWIILLFFTLFTISFIVTSGLRFLEQLYSTLPSFNQLQNIEQSVVSRVFDGKGSLLHEFHIERRFWVPLEKIPVSMQNAAIAIEDRRFYSHWGVDVKRIFGAAMVDILRGHIAQGASTITQQLARNVYLTSRQSIIRKIREALTAVQLETCYTKNEILELYLNQVYLGAGVYGIEAASQYYFSKHVQDLTLEECALLAGLIQIPERYRPDKSANIERITNRRNTVLRAMEAMNFIDKNHREQTASIPVKPNIQKIKSPIGSYYVEMVRQYVANRYGDDLLYNGGLAIHTTLDPVAQDSSERALAVQIASLQARLNRIFLDSTQVDKKSGIGREKFLAKFDSLYNLHEEEYKAFPDSVKLRQAQMALIAMDVSSGAIRALIGGRDFVESKFNRAIMARRLPGSAFKPFVYTAALENGFTPASVVLDQPITLMTDQGEWRPENYDRVFNGPITIRNSLAKSVNLVAIQVLNKVGANVVIDYARRFGLKHRMNPVPSLAIGTCEATPIEMTTAYMAYANNGIINTPYYIEKIVDKTGRILESHQSEEKEVLTPQTAFLMTSLLRSVVCCGTGASIPGLGFTRPAAGKTGTTDDCIDAWFIGFTPQIVCGVWAGVDDHLSLGNGVTGSVAAIPVWVKAMTSLHRNIPARDFEVPEGIKTDIICKESHKVALPSCSKTESEFFLSETVVDTCTIHGSGRRVPADMIKFFSGQQQTGGKKSDEAKKKKPLMF